MPWLGGFGVTCLRILHILDILEAESLKVFDQKKKEMDNGDFDDEGPKDVLATLCQCLLYSFNVVSEVIQ